MDVLLEKSDNLIELISSKFKRYLYHRVNWNNRLSGIKGARGTGKTTMLLQRLYEMGKPAVEAAYFSLDDLYFFSHSFLETARTFYKQGGKYLFLDEVHKYPGWAREIKNLYDQYPDLSIVFSGSSIIDISRAEADLSRRALMHELHGFSYREYLEFKNGVEMPVFSLDQVLEYPSGVRKRFPSDWRPFKYFNEYLSYGYYPFFKEDMAGYHQRL